MEPRRILGRLIVLTALGSIIPVASAMAGETYAFLVAVADYDVKQLRDLEYTRNDILAFHQALLDTGVQKQNIVLLHDDPERFTSRRFLPEAEKIRKEFGLLIAGLEKEDTLIVAFAGHGVQFKGDETNYFCPADADLEDPERQRLISFGEIYQKLKGCKAGRKLLLVDACRDDPLSQLARSRDTVELESVTRPQSEPVPEGIVALFSCAAGQRSFEWPDLKHGVFFYHVLEAWNGKADDGDQELTLDELVYFTKKETFTFARTNLATVQTPEFRGEFSGRWVLREFDAGLPTIVTNSIGVKLVLIPAGIFMMGSPISEQGRDTDEYLHRVKITQPFYLGAYEVTCGQFRKFVEATGYRTEPERDGEGGWGWSKATGEFEGRDRKYTWRNTGFPQTDEHPVVNVTWNDAVAFCQWLSKREGVEYRLPTEAQWEYACRAGTTTAYFSGDHPKSLVHIGNVADATAKAKWTNYPDISFTSAADGHAFTAPVGSFQPNAFGLFDLHGNVQEWCADCYSVDYYPQSPTADPTGPAEGQYQVNRGGGWYLSAANCRSAYRFRNSPSFPHSYLGFRVARVPSGQ